MIYLANRRYTDTAQGWLESIRCEDLADRIRILSYQELAKTRTLPTGTYIFTDYERLRPTQWTLVRHVFDRLSAMGDAVRLLNDPRRVLTRGPLLARMHAEGINDFRAVRADGPFEGLRYPVFVREEADHTGSLTDLIPDEATLDRELGRLTGPLTKHRRRGLLVVEFCDTADERGLYLKLSAFRVGDRIQARYHTFHPHWVVRMSGSVVTKETIEAEHRFVSGHRDEDWQRKIFDMAGITFGRLDYGLLDGRPQVWEINTNPTFGPMPARRTARTGGWDLARSSPELTDLREPTRRLIHERFRSALRAIDQPEREDPPVALRVPASLRRRLAAEEGIAALRRLKSRLAKKVAR